MNYTHLTNVGIHKMIFNVIIKGTITIKIGIINEKGPFFL